PENALAIGIMALALQQPAVFADGLQAVQGVVVQGAPADAHGQARSVTPWPGGVQRRAVVVPGVKAAQRRRRRCLRWAGCARPVQGNRQPRLRVVSVRGHPVRTRAEQAVADDAALLVVGQCLGKYRLAAAVGHGDAGQLARTQPAHRAQAVAVFVARAAVGGPAQQRVRASGRVDPVDARQPPGIPMVGERTSLWQFVPDYARAYVAYEIFPVRQARDAVFAGWPHDASHPQPALRVILAVFDLVRMLGADDARAFPLRAQRHGRRIRAGATRLDGRGPALRIVLVMAAVAAGVALDERTP